MPDLTREEIVVCIKDILDPLGVTLVDLPHEQYIAEARANDFIAQQIAAGIYDPTTFDQEFLSTARSYSQERVVEIDSALIASHMRGVARPLAFGYCAHLALHEYHHIEYHHDWAEDVEEQIAREIECDRFLLTHAPEIVALKDQAEKSSRTFQNVYRRIATLRP